MHKKYIVRLTQQQRSQLETLLRSGRAHARKLLYGRILCSRPTLMDPTDVPTSASLLMPWRFPPPRWRASADASVRRGWKWRFDAQEAWQAQEEEAR
jgi:hypothetical protein